MEEKKYDLVIAGAGPAGITTAITFKKYNLSSKILVFDIQEFPRFKIGEVILPGACEILKKLDLLESIKKYNFPRKMGVFYYWGKSKKKGFLLPSNNLKKINGIYNDFTPNIFSYHVERKKYDYELIIQAKKKGIEVITGIKDFKVNFNKNLNKVENIILQNKKIDSNFFIDATGIYSGIIPYKTKKIVVGDYSGDVCFHGYLKGAKFLHDFKGLENRLATTVGSYKNDCWFWYIPIDKEIVSVGIVFKSKNNKNFFKIDKEKLILKILYSFAKTKKAIKDAYFINYSGLPKINVIKNWNSFSNNLFGKNWLLVGDSAFFSDPILSAGVTMAHRTGFYAGVMLNYYFRTNNLNFKKELLNTYKNYCLDFYNQVSDIIKFWYDGMDDNLPIKELFRKGDDTIKKFGVIDNLDVNNSFLYIVNGLLQTLDGNGDELSGDYEQEDYQNLIKGLTGIDIEFGKINKNKIYKINLDYNINKKLRFIGEKLKYFSYIYIKNKYNSNFFISDYISYCLDCIKNNSNKTIMEIYKMVSKKYIFLEEKKFFTNIKKLEYLGLLKEV